MAKILNLWLVIEDDDGDTKILKNSDPFFFGASNTCRERANLGDDSEFEVLTEKGTESFTLLFKSSDKSECERYLEEIYEDEGEEDWTDEEEDEIADVWFVVKCPDNDLWIKQNSDPDFFATANNTMEERAQLPTGTKFDFASNCPCCKPNSFTLMFKSMDYDDCVAYKRNAMQLLSLKYLQTVDLKVALFKNVTSVNLKAFNNVVHTCLKVVVPYDDPIVVGSIDKFGRLKFHTAELNRIKNKRSPSVHDLFSRCFFDERFDPCLPKDLLDTQHVLFVWKFNRAKGTVKEATVGEEFNRKIIYLMFVTKKNFIVQMNGQTMFKLLDHPEGTYKSTIEIQKLVIAQLIFARDAEEESQEFPLDH